MKRPLAFSCMFCLVAGLLMGSVLPLPWDTDLATPPAANAMLRDPALPGSSQGNTLLNTPITPLDTKNNLTLLSTANYVVQALKREDYLAISTVVDPQRGVTFTPYSTVDFQSDKTFTRDQIKNLASDTTVYTWGLTDGRGSFINLTMQQYFHQFVFDKDYTQADEIGIDQIMLSGNALENLAVEYPDCRFVDYFLSGQTGSGQGLDWSSLKLVFAPGDTAWYLVGVVHGQWTI